MFIGIFETLVDDEWTPNLVAVELRGETFVAALRRAERVLYTRADLNKMITVLDLDQATALNNELVAAIHNLVSASRNRGGGG